MNQPTFSNPTVEKIYQDGLKHIEIIRSQNKWEDGILVMPFTCYICSKQRHDFFMTTGDGVPMCKQCFDNIAGVLDDQVTV